MSTVLALIALRDAMTVAHARDDSTRSERSAAHADAADERFARACWAALDSGADVDWRVLCASRPGEPAYIGDIAAMLVDVGRLTG